MIMVNTILKVADNSGALRVKCIGLFNNKKRAEVGDVITTVVLKSYAQSKAKIKTSSIVKGVVVRTRKKQKRKNNVYVKFEDNAIVVIDDRKNPIGTRIFGAVASELRGKDFARIISLAPDII
uniref:Large ribosomal subunit protein uL14c n=1 Tax=Chromera velia TaxID=505693 RepID=D9IXF2_9ALVE|nr:ribosomal protein L14 [Chromera velia]ADJ66560.1 ribosomal protein L14 [Chromera velia]